MEQKFYAQIEEVYNWVAVFDTQEERDRWVNFQDDFSKDFFTQEDRLETPRIAITEKEAAEITGFNIYEPTAVIPDDFDPSIHWYNDLYCGNPVA